MDLSVFLHSVRGVNTALKKIIYDFEVYKGRVCLCVMNPDTGNHRVYDGVDQIKALPLEAYIWIGFNNGRYDHIIFKAIHAGLNETEVYRLSKAIIREKHAVEQRFTYKQRTGLQPELERLLMAARYLDVDDLKVYDDLRDFAGWKQWDHNIIDLYEIYPAQQAASLKEFGHRLRYPILRNLPYDFDKVLNDDEWEEVKKYCVHDVNITKLFWEKLRVEWESRHMVCEMFGINPFGKTAKLAENAMLSQLDGGYIQDKAEYIKPTKLILNEYFDDVVEQLYAFDYVANKYNSDKSLRFPQVMQKSHTIGDLVIELRKGGIHGMASPGEYRDCYLYDVSSQYPAILIKFGLGSERFRQVLEPLFEQRLQLKALNDPRANALKLVLNSLSGKLEQDGRDEQGNVKYPVNPQIYAPHVATSMRLIGQLVTVDLILKCPENSIFYANTDGIISRVKLDEKIIADFEARTGLILECTKVDYLLLLNVNSYYMLCGDKEIRKKDFLELNWKNSASASVVGDAVVNNFRYSTSIEDYIKAEKDAFKFMYFVKSKAGSDNSLILDGVVLTDPKIRFYISKKGGTLYTKTESRTAAIAKDRFVKICMNMTEFDFDNIDYDFYIKKAYELRDRIVSGEVNDE